MVCLKKIYEKDYAILLLKDIENCFEAEIKRKISAGIIFSKKYRKQVYAALIVNLGQHLSGLPFFVFYSTNLFDALSGNGEYMAFVGQLFSLIAYFLVNLVGDRLGRKFLLSNGVLFQGISYVAMVLLAQYNLKDYLIAPLFVYQITSSLGMNSTPLIYTTDILPAVGMGIILSLNWIALAVVTKILPLLMLR